MRSTVYKPAVKLRSSALHKCWTHRTVESIIFWQTIFTADVSAMQQTSRCWHIPLLFSYGSNPSNHKWCRCTWVCVYSLCVWHAWLDTHSWTTDVVYASGGLFYSTCRTLSSSVASYTRTLSQHARPSGVLRRRSDGLECAAWRPPRPVAQCRQFPEEAKDASVSECTWTQRRCIMHYINLRLTYLHLIVIYSVHYNTHQSEFHFLHLKY